MTDVRAVALNEKIPFRCRLCGGCCRYVKDSVMLEPIDVYRLTRHLREQGEPVSGIEDVLENYAHASWLEDRFPVFLLNTVGAMDVCVFLKEGRCSIYEARPHVCRVYPFSVAAGERGRDFRYFLCKEKSHHFILVPHVAQSGEVGVLVHAAGQHILARSINYLIGREV